MKAFFKRSLQLSDVLNRKSAFLFGARGTGKTTLIQSQLPEARVYDLLEEKTYLKLLQDSSILDQENQDKRLIVIDEIQKLPKLLDEVQRLIVKKNYRFLLTGSSARKLKSAGVNLLGGRALELHLFPLIWNEIPGFQLERFLNHGGLPEVYQSEKPEDDLKSYLGFYLREEVSREAFVRRIEHFTKFLDLIAIQNGEELHFSNLASDTGFKARTIENYIEVLEDTLLGFRLPPFEKTRKRKPITRSKFYLFDLGVTRLLSKQSEMRDGSVAFGKAFEHFLILEIRAALRYQRRDIPLAYWRTKNGYEVDVIIGDETALEIKATSQPTDRHLRGLRALREEGVLKRYRLICQVEHPRMIDGIEILPWEHYLRELWDGH